MSLLRIVPEGYATPRAPKAPERLRLDLARQMARTIHEHELIRAGDKILVAISGGKDSYTLFDLLEEARKKSPVKFELIAYHLDQVQPGYDGTSLRAWLEAFGAPFEIHSEDTYSAVIADAEQRLGADSALIDAILAHLRATADGGHGAEDMAAVIHAHRA